MTSRTYHKMFSIGIVGLLLVFGCTSSPVGGGDISKDFSKIEGKVVLSDSLNSEGVYVWLEGFDISTFTDETGRFEINLPSAGQDTPNDITGVFNLYYYLSNYYLANTPLAVRDGMFVYSQGEVNQVGEIVVPKEIKKFLHVKTELNLPFVSRDFQGSMIVFVTLGALIDTQTKIDTVSANLINFDDDFTGRIYFRNIASNAVFEFDTQVAGADKLIRNRPETRLMVFYMNRFALPTGEYKIIPHVYVKHDAVPDGLLGSLGVSAEDLGLNYLNLPFKREVGHFEVKN